MNNTKPEQLTAIAMEEFKKLHIEEIYWLTFKQSFLKAYELGRTNKN